MEGGGRPGGPDEMLQQLMQMMGGGNGDPNGPQLPPGLENLFGSAFPGGFPEAAAGQEGKQQQAVPPPSDSTYLWRIAHAVFSLFLALYVTLSSSVMFAGSKAAREQSMMSGVGADFGQRLFVWFATVEVVLQSSRYFLERGQIVNSGMLGTLINFLPPKYGGYVRLVVRYGVFLKTVVQDALVVVFALGAVAWWNGMIES
jgi:hypothetical protein